MAIRVVFAEDNYLVREGTSALLRETEDIEAKVSSLFSKISHPVLANLKLSAGPGIRLEEIYPPQLGCHDEIQATQGTPLKGTTLLHMCADYNEIEIARWLIEHGADLNARADVDSDGFGGHTPLFCTVVSQPNFWMNYTGGWAHARRPQVAPFTQLLLDHGAAPNVRASLRKKLHPGYGPQYDVENVYEYRDVTALSWGKRFHAKVFVSGPAMRLIEEHGGKE